MIDKLLTYLFSIPPIYHDSLDQQRARTLLLFNWLILAAWFIRWGLGVQPYPNLLVPLGVSVVVIAFFVAVFGALRRGYLAFASHMFVGFLLLASATVVYRLPQLTPELILVLMLPIAAAAVLYNRQGVIVVGGLLSALVFIGGIVNIETTLNLFTYTGQAAALIVMATIMLAIFAGHKQGEAESSVETASRLTAIIAITSDVNAETSLAQVYQRTLRFLRDAFQYDFAQIYLLNDDQRFTARVRSGVQDVEELKGDDVLALGDANVISESARIQRMIFVTSQDEPNRTRFLLPSLQRSVVIPIIHEGRTLGVIDVQSTQSNPVQLSEERLLPILARELGAVMYLLRHIGDMKRNLSEQEARANRMQAQLTALHVQRRQLVGREWGDYIEQRGKSALGFDLENQEIRHADDIPESIRNVLAAGEVSNVEENGRDVLFVPIILRDEVLGAMTFTMPPGQGVTQRQIELAGTVALRLGGALENKRLLEQTQAQALRERQAGEVANMLIGATDVRSLLELAADSFNDTLGAVQTQIYLESQLLPDISPATSPVQPKLDGDSTPPTNGDGA